MAASGITAVRVSTGGRLGFGVSTLARQRKVTASSWAPGYEQLYGHGAALPGAQLEAVTFRCRASVETPKPSLTPVDNLTDVIPEAAKRPFREIYWTEWEKKAETPIYDGAVLVPGNRIEGPAVLETEVTSVVLHPGETLTVDKFGNFEIQFDAA